MARVKHVREGAEKLPQTHVGKGMKGGRGRYTFSGKGNQRVEREGMSSVKEGILMRYTAEAVRALEGSLEFTSETRFVSELSSLTASEFQGFASMYFITCLPATQKCFPLGKDDLQTRQMCLITHLPQPTRRRSLHGLHGDVSNSAMCFVTYLPSAHQEVLSKRGSTRAALTRRATTTASQICRGMIWDGMRRGAS